MTIRTALVNYANSSLADFAPLLVGAFTGLFVFLIILLHSDSRRMHLPPGPKPRPFIGNLFDIPLTHEWLTWQSYIERYGDIVFLSALGKKILLLGSHQAITDLMEKRVNFNDRPRSAMLSDLMDFTWMLPAQPYGDHWRLGRKLLHTHVHAGASMDYAPVQLQGAQSFVRDLLEAEASRPTGRLSDAAKAILPQVVRSNFGATAVRVTYGINVRDAITKGKYIDVPETVVYAISEAATPGRFLVDFFPWLKYIPSWLPGAGFQDLAADAKALHIRMRDDPMEVTKAYLAAGIAPVSIAGRLLQDSPLDEQMVKYLAGVVYVAGSDTTVGAVTSFFLGLLVEPDVQAQAQEELDRVVGRHRLPDFSDKSDLPFLDAIVRECLRWLPAIPNGVAHATSEDDQYRGYFIPKGTVVLPLQWGLLHDPKTYPSPSIFSPERHLNRLHDGTWELRKDVPDPRTYAFGFGRRACPGTHIADQGLFATFATVLHTLEIVRAKDKDGEEVVPDVCVTSGLISHTLPFPYELRMRADARDPVDMCVAAADEQSLSFQSK